MALMVVDRMHICFSSGASPQYLRDVLRALTLPRGARLQFRYDLKRVGAGVRDSLGSAPWKSTAALIAYVDQAGKAQPRFVPCRFATIVDVAVHGTTASLVLELQEFASTDDCAGFTEQLRGMAADDEAPRRDDDGKIVGHHWTLSRPSELVRRSAALEAWERIVGQLATHEDFHATTAFFHMAGVLRIATSKSAEFRAGRLQLTAATEYEASIYHFHPGQYVAAAGDVLELTLGDGAGRFISNPKVPLDSRYDLKRVRFTTSDATLDYQSYLTLSTANATTESTTTEIPLSINGLVFKTLLGGLGLGALLAVPQVVAALNNPQLPARNLVVVVAVAVGVGILTGVFAAFGLKKSV